MVLKICIVSFLFISSIAWTQIDGKAYYKVQIQIPENSKETPQEFQEFERKLARMANNVLYELSFTNSTSRFRIVESMNSDENKLVTQNIFDSGEYYIDSHTNIIQNRKTLENKKYIINLEPLCWTILNESRVVNGYECIKAISSQIFYSERKGVNQTQEIVAWFTPEIPVSLGPKQFYGLPGLVVEVTGEGATYTLEKLIMKNDSVKITPFTKGEEVSIEEFQRIQKRLRNSFKKYFSIE